MFETLTHSSHHTEKIGEAMGSCLNAGDVVLLYGRLGAGKTTITKGICKALGYRGHVTSPTFTIVNEYMGQNFPIYHMDLYRLEEDGAWDMGIDEYLFGEGVSIVEWPDSAENLFTMSAVRVYLDYISEIERKISVEAPKQIEDKLADMVNAW